MNFNIFLMKISLNDKKNKLVTLVFNRQNKTLVTMSHTIYSKTDLDFFSATSEAVEGGRTEAKVTEEFL